MKYTLITVAAMASCLALNATAQSPAVSAVAPSASAVPAGPAKIAVISFQEAVAQTNDFQRRFADLQKKYDPKRQQIKTLSDEITGLQKELQAQSATLSDAERASKAKLLDDKQKELKRSGEDAQADFQQDMQQTFSAVAGKFAETMNAYAVEHGFSLVLDNGNQQLPVVLYSNPSVDISRAIIEAYNVKSGIPAPTPAAGAPGARGTAPARTPAAPKPTGAH
ncbi:MAG: OmpH family outer membrane protein [Terracidiphilus sp.]